MRAFIFDKYGYYPNDEYASEFDYQGWHFKLELNNKTEKELKDYDDFLSNILFYFPHMGAKIIVSRDQRYASNSEYGQVSLVAVKDDNVTLNDVYTMHVNFKNTGQENKMKVSYLQTLWENKVELIENKALPSLKVDNYFYVQAVESVTHALGMAENAIQYLSDARLDFGDDITNTTLAHKRLNSLDAYTFLNPFNLVVDSPIRDLAELYKAGLISSEELIQYLPAYNFNTFDATLLFARLLFPTKIFDLFEDHYGIKKDIKLEVIRYRENIKPMMDDLKKVHIYLINMYSIRPIAWLLE